MNKKMQYEVYTDEILKLHCSYLVEADSEDEARARFEEQRKNGNYDDTPQGDIYEAELIGYEIYEY